MPLDISCFQISAEINACGTDIKMGDYKRVGVCLPYSDIIKGSIVYDGCKVNFSALPGAFAIYDKSNVPFNGSAISEEMGTRFMKYNELVVFPAFEHTPENAYAIYKMMQGGERFVVILEQEKPNATGTNRFQVFGMESGLKFKEGKSDKENQAANVVTLEQLNTGRPATYLYDTSDAVTIAKVDTLLSYDLIYGGTIANGGSVKLTIDNDKTGYIKLPNGTLLTTVAGAIDTTYTGLGGAITIYSPKTNTDTNIDGSDIAGTLTRSSTAAFSFAGCMNIVGVISANGLLFNCGGSTSFANLVAPKATTIYGSSCAFTAKSIGDILYAAYTDNREDVVYDFSGGTSASETQIESYLLSEYSLVWADVYTELVTNNGGTITINL